jgi:D-tyrosyl-tRNA(Tyr) deacylase
MHIPYIVDALFHFPPSLHNMTLLLQPGILAFVGIHEEDSEIDLAYCCKRLLGCKLWQISDGKPWRQHVKQMSYDLLLVSQFTLYGTLMKKNQPDYKRAMKSEPAKILYDHFLQLLCKNYVDDKIHDGVLGQMVEVKLVNDGPVTIIIESRNVDSKTDECVEE